MPLLHHLDTGRTVEQPTAHIYAGAHEPLVLAGSLPVAALVSSSAEEGVRCGHMVAAAGVTVAEHQHPHATCS